ncbi:MAG: hypothetical protein D6729_01085, partial [Deltaproteobacteria bacterium]
MAKKKKEAAPPEPSTRSLVAVTAIGIVSALWALFQWAELLVLRAGGTPFCAVSETLDCNAVWNSDFAGLVHRSTGLPIAGWGLVWSLVVIALGLWALLLRGEGRRLGAVTTAIRLSAWVGVVISLGLAGVSLAAGALCLGCLGTYLLVAILAGITLFGWRGLGFPEVAKGLGRAALLTAAAYLVLLWPGLSTPGDAAAEAGQAALAAIRASRTAAGEDSPKANANATPGPAGSDATPAPPPKEEIPPPPFATGEPTGDEARDTRIVHFLDTLPAPLRQMLSDGLLAFHTSPQRTLPPPRAPIGPKDAPVRI